MRKKRFQADLSCPVDVLQVVVQEYFRIWENEQILNVVPNLPKMRDFKVSFRIYETMTFRELRTVLAEIEGETIEWARLFIGKEWALTCNRPGLLASFIETIRKRFNTMRLEIRKSYRESLSTKRKVERLAAASPQLRKFGAGALGAAAPSE